MVRELVRNVVHRLFGRVIPSYDLGDITFTQEEILEDLTFHGRRGLVAPQANKARSRALLN